MAIVLPKFSRRRSPARSAAETQPAVNVTLCRDDGVYEAGNLLQATWRVRRVGADEVQCVELSVMWHTEGKGDEDLHVHHFERLVENQLRHRQLSDAQNLRCDLPVTPLSYHGRLISVCWCIRLRLFLSGGREIVAEQPFHLISAGSNPRLAHFSRHAGRHEHGASVRGIHDSTLLDHSIPDLSSGEPTTHRSNPRVKVLPVLAPRRGAGLSSATR